MIATFVHHPQRLWLRRVLFQIHLWAGILLSLYLVVIGTTGSILVFEDELSALAMPKIRNAALASAPQLQAEDAAHLAQRAMPGAHAFFISLPQPDQPFYRVWLKNSAGHQTIAVIDPRNGDLLSHRDLAWLEWVHDLHIYLLLGPSGLIVNGVCAVALLLLAVTGLVLWWRGLARWTRGLWISGSSNWRRINFDLHSAVGFWTLAIVFWWAISGIYFAWPMQIAALVNRFSQLQGMRAPNVRDEGLSKSGHTNLASILAVAQRQTPGGSVSGVALPLNPAGNVIVYVDSRRPGDFSHRDINYFGASSGRLLATWHYGENRTAGDWILWAMHPLHFGTLWGLGPKILWALLGLSLPALTVTGLLMYWNRKLRFLRSSVSRRAAQASGEADAPMNVGCPRSRF